MRKLLPLLAVAALIAGCGGDDDPVEGGAIGLTRWLPKDGTGYVAVDITAFKEELDLPEDSDPTEEAALEQHVAVPFRQLLPGGLGSPDGKPGRRAAHGAVLEAVDPGAVTAVAAGSVNEDSIVAAFATTADTGEIGSRLGDLGYRERAGILVRGRTEPAIRLERGLIFASSDPDALREIPDEQRDDPPAKLLSELDGDDVAVYRFDVGCARETGAAVEADGEAEIAVLASGKVEGERMTPDTGEVGEVEVDGDVVAKPVIDPGAGATAQALLRLFPGYDCE